MIKVSRLSNNLSKQSDTSLAWIMFYHISHKYRDIIKQETVQSSLMIQGLHVDFESTKDSVTSPITPNLSIPLQPIMPLDPTTVTTIP